MSEVMQTCPGCRGRKKVFAFASHPDGSCKAGWWDCSTCAGSGEVTEETAERHEAGRRLRKARLDRGLSLREEARRLGVTPMVLSARERGRA